MERLKSLFQVGIMLIICIFGIIFVKPSHSEVITSVAQKDTVPDFYSKSAKEGLYDALLFYNIKHPDIVYAQAILETGNFTSKLCVEGNNLFGLRSKNYFKYNHWTESVIDYKNKIQYRYKNNENYYLFLKRINYAEDSLYISKLKSIKVNETR